MSGEKEERNGCEVDGGRRVRRRRGYGRGERRRGRAEERQFCWLQSSVLSHPSLRKFSAFSSAKTFPSPPPLHPRLPSPPLPALLLLPQGTILIRICHYGNINAAKFTDCISRPGQFSWSGPPLTGRGAGRSHGDGLNCTAAQFSPRRSFFTREPHRSRSEAPGVTQEISPGGTAEALAAGLESPSLEGESFFLLPSNN